MVPASRVHLVLEEWGRKHGPIFKVSAAGRQVIGINDMDTINWILRDRPEGFRRWSNIEQILQEVYEAVPEMKGTPPAVFAAEGDEWKRQRRLIINSLNKDHLHRYFSVVRTATERLYRRLQSKAATGEPVTIADEMTSFTIDVTSALAFGYDLNTLEGKGGSLLHHMHRVQTMSGRRLITPVAYWRWVKLPADRALDRSMVEVYRSTAGFIERARERMAARPELFEEPENLIEGLLAAQKADRSFTDQEIVGNLLAILFAGEDTTSHTLAWTTWLLASRSDIQQRLGEEATAALGEHPFPVEYETAERLPYAEAVLRESLHFKSVGPMLGVEPVEDREICGTHIPAGTQLILLLRQAHGGAGAGLESFRPERWLEDNEAASAPKSLTFGAGPRFCPGRNLAFLESKAALGMLARNFDVELDESGGPVREAIRLTMIADGLRVRLRPRTKEYEPQPASIGQAS